MLSALDRSATALRMLSRASLALPRRAKRACALGPRSCRPWPAPSLPLPRAFWWSSAPPAVDTIALASSSIPSISPDITLLILAVVLASTASDDDDAAADPPWTVVDLSSDGLGLGALSSRPISRGELILSERPLCIWPQGLSSERARELFDAMSDRQQAVFMALSRTPGSDLDRMDDILSRRATNGFAVQLPGSGKTVGMVFPKLARLNHSCLPNVSQAMNHGTLRMELYALQDLPSNTPLTIEYLPSLILLPYAERQAALKDSFGFSRCLCVLCSSPEHERLKSDARRNELRDLGRELARGGGERKATLEKMERLRVLLKDEGYLGLPEFEDQGVSNAYAVYTTLHSRSQKGTM